ncbi:MAG: hypothetical protein V7K18_13555 [Nostoc sp.]|uniref:hypothetical protein n=1 Tax=Nostoc sp. TaxID=1180 RepID=UPI002FFD275B
MIGTHKSGLADFPDIVCGYGLGASFFFSIRTPISVSRRIGQLRSLLGQVISVSLDENRQKRSHGFITLLQIAL